MEIRTTSDGFKWTSVSDLSNELEGLQVILDKFNCFPFNMGVCLRVLESGSGWTSKSRYSKSDNYLDMDIVVYENELLSMRNNLNLKRKVFGEELYRFFVESMTRCEEKFPELRSINPEFFIDLKSWLTENNWIGQV